MAIARNLPDDLMSIDTRKEIWRDSKVTNIA